MWTSSQRKNAGVQLQGGANLGVVTAAGNENGVALGTERRWLRVMAPGGYRWKPKAGEQVLVLKLGQDGESACILACPEQEGDDLLPGEVELQAEGCALKLNNNGAVELRGDVWINGTRLEDMVRAVAAEVLSVSVRQEE